MSRKLPRNISSERTARKGILIRNYEEDIRGRKLKSKSHTKPKQESNNIINADNRFAGRTALEESPPDAILAEGDFEGIEIDWEEFVSEEAIPASNERRVSAQRICCKFYE
jgi:hypothetical protein